MDARATLSLPEKFGGNRVVLHGKGFMTLNFQPTQEPGFLVQLGINK